MQVGILDYGIIAIYFIFVLGIGFALKKQMVSSADFCLSGRSIPAQLVDDRLHTGFGVVLAHTVLGGLTSSIYNEVLQFFLIVFGLLPLTLIGLANAGGQGCLMAGGGSGGIFWQRERRRLPSGKIIGGKGSVQCACLCGHSEEGRSPDEESSMLKTKPMSAGALFVDGLAVGEILRSPRSLRITSPCSSLNMFNWGMLLPGLTVVLLLLVLAAAAAPAAESGSSRAPRVETIRVSERRSNLLLFNTGKELLARPIGRSELVALGSPGTLVSIDEGRLVFHTGRLLVATGKTSLDIGMRLGTLRIAAHAAVVVDAHPHLPARVMCVGGSGGPVVKIKTRGRLGQIVWLSPGEELVLSDRLLNPEAHAPPDGLKRRALPLGVEVRGLELAKNSFSVSELFKQESGRAGHAQVAGQPAVRRLLSIIAAAASATDPQFKAPAASGGTLLGGASVEPVHILASGGSEFAQLADGTVGVRRGSVFIHPDGDLVVKTGIAQVKIDRDGLVLVESEGGLTRAAALSGPGHVELVAGSRSFPLSPGQEVLLTDHAPKPEETMPRDGVGRRRMSTTEAGDGLFASFADVSIVSLMHSAGHLRPLRRPSTAAEKRVLERLIRTAAALDATTRARGPFKAQPKEKAPQPTSPSKPAGPVTVNPFLLLTDLAATV